MTDFKKLRVWQISHHLTIRVYKLTSLLPKDELFGLISQLRRAAISVELNIAESEGRFNKKEKIQFFYTARASGVEVRAALEIVCDLYPNLKKMANELSNEYQEFESQLNSLIGYRKKLS